MQTFKICLIFLLSVISSSFAAKILVMVPMPAKSHAILFDRLIVELAKKGHDVTYITAFPLKQNLPNLKQVVMEKGQQLLQDNLKMDIFELRHMTTLQNTVFLPLMGLGLCEALLNDPKIIKLKDEKFDLIMGEAFLSESMLAGFSHKSKAPLITLATFMPNVWASFMVGNPAPSSYIPDPFTGYPNKMTFFQRVNNFLIGVIAELNHEWFYLPKQDAIMKKHFGDHLPSVKEIIKNTSVVFVNHHHSLAFPRPYNPNMIEIAGIHIEPPKKLPQDLQSFMDEAKEGVILFSMGSNLKSSLMSKEKIQTFLNAFGRLKQKVLWKFEDDSLPGAPKNVKISKWLPQSDILAHPNLKVFFTHGGLLSTTESILRGVPIVGMPIFGDQPVNMRTAVNSGFGRSLDFDTVTSDQIVEALNDVINNPKYREVVQQKSAVLKDRPAPPLETALYWIEYVIRHKGAPHLRSAVQDLNLFQKYLIDVIAVLAGFIFITLCIIKSTFRLIFTKLCGGNKSKRSEKKVASQKKKN